MDTVAALKLIRVVEKCLHDAQTNYQGDKMLTFLDALHEAGYEIVPMGLDLSKITVSPAEVVEKMRAAQYTTNGTSTASISAFQPNREETQEELAQQKRNMGGIF